MSVAIPDLEAEIRVLVEAGHEDFVAEVRHRHPDLTYIDFHIAASRAFRSLGYPEVRLCEMRRRMMTGEE
jgi:hypothetical protein